MHAPLANFSVFKFWKFNVLLCYGLKHKTLMRYIHFFSYVTKCEIKESAYFCKAISVYLLSDSMRKSICAQIPVMSVKRRMSVGGVWEWAESFKAWQFSHICRSTPTFGEFFMKWTLFVWPDWRWVVQENFVFKIACIFCCWYTAEEMSFFAETQEQQQWQWGEGGWGVGWG